MARRIASLLPSATEIAYALGLGDQVVGVSHSCDYPPAVRSKPRLTRLRVALAGLASGEIDAAVRRALDEFGSVYEVDTGRLTALGPDLVLTQGTCDVCAVPTREAERAAARLPQCADVLSLDAHDVAGVLADIVTVGRAAGVAERAAACVGALERRIAAVRDRVAGRPRPRVLALEWLDPPFVPGHWVPELVELAGGHLVLGATGRRSYALRWEELAGADPDVLLIMPCGYGLAASRAAATCYAERLRAVAGRAIQSGRAYVVDASSYFSRPGPRVVGGLELLAGLLHADVLGAAPPAGKAERWPRADAGYISMT